MEIIGPPTPNRATAIKRGCTNTPAVQNRTGAKGHQNIGQLPGAEDKSHLRIADAEVIQDGGDERKYGARDDAKADVEQPQQNQHDPAVMAAIDFILFVGQQPYLSNLEIPVPYAFSFLNVMPDSIRHAALYRVKK
jgi:hypothetical protein